VAQSAAPVVFAGIAGTEVAAETAAAEVAAETAAEVAAETAAEVAAETAAEVAAETAAEVAAETAAEAALADMDSAVAVAETSGTVKLVDPCSVEELTRHLLGQ